MALDLDGLIPATVLPMAADGRPSTNRPCGPTSRVVEQGPVALAINVDTGEGPHLTHDEKIAIIQVIRDVTDLPIVAGLAGPSTDAAVRQARDFKSAGADSLLVFPIPAYLASPSIRVSRRVPHGDRRGRAAAHPLPAAAGVGGELRGRRSRGDGSRRGRRGDQGGSFDARRFVDTARLLEQLPKRITLLTGNDNFILESFLLGATGALIGFGVMTREQVDTIRAWHEAGPTTRWPRQAGPAAGRCRIRRASRRLPGPAQGGLRILVCRVCDRSAAAPADLRRRARH